MPNPTFIPKIVYNATTLNFTYPAVDDPFNEVITPSNNEAVSSSGIIQASNNFIEEARTVKLSLLTSTQIGTLRTFFTTWGMLRKAFDYYESAELSSSGTYTLSNSSFAPKRLVPDGSGDFLYEITLNMRRVI